MRIYFYKINDIIDRSREYKMQRLILDRINQTENFIKMNLRNLNREVCCIFGSENSIL